MEHTFNVTSVNTRILGGPMVCAEISFDVTLKIYQWKNGMITTFLSTTADSDQFSFEGNGFMLDMTDDKKFIVLRFSLIGEGNNSLLGGVMFTTDMPVPPEFE